MRTYSVDEVADMLGINSTTVRRWIHSKKLVASIHSRKEGFLINEADLLCFSKRTSKYRSLGFMIETGTRLERGQETTLEQALVDHIGYLEKQLEQKQAEVTELQAELEKVKGMSVYLDRLHRHHC